MGEGEDPLRMVNGVQGPVRDIVTDPEYLDVTVHGREPRSFTYQDWQNAFAYVVMEKGTSTQTGIRILMRWSAPTTSILRGSCLCGNETVVLIRRRVRK